MFTVNTMVLLGSSSKNADSEYNDAAEEPEGWIQDASIAVPLMTETENEDGGVRAVKMCVE
jgi:hypothetical protein